ncbi:MAG: hypothetical protein KAU03_07190 [Candidatus Altiarchaeales archaeon]|nr:hypothetical protein [Candidatus Altiarchaeales archaeon]
MKWGGRKQPTPSNTWTANYMRSHSTSKHSKYPNSPPKTLYNSGQIRQRLMTRDEAMNIENRKLNKPKPPKELESSLKDIKISYDDFINSAQEPGKAKQYNPKTGTILRKIYHSKRKKKTTEKQHQQYKNHPKQTQPTQPYNQKPQKKPYTSTP